MDGVGRVARFFVALGPTAVVALALAAVGPGGAPARPVSAAAAAKPATLKGSLAGARLPAAGQGVAGIRAVSLADGVVTAAGYAGRGGRWRLTMPAGGYALIASVVWFRKSPTVDALVALARGRAGRTSTLRLSLKPKRSGAQRRAHARAAVQPGFGSVSVPYPAIWVHHFAVHSQDPALGVLGKGLADMLISDLSTMSSTVPACRAGRSASRAVVVEREKIGELLNEQKLQQTPGFDPSTRVRRDQIIRDNSSVTGTVAQAGGQMTLTATYINRQTGSAGTVSVTGSPQQFFELEQQLFAKLANLICKPPPVAPRAYVGTFAGSRHSSGDTQDTTETWHVTGAVFERNPRSSDRYPWYDLKAGTVEYSISGRYLVQCRIGAHATVSLAGASGQISFITGDGSYTATAGSNARITATVTCPENAMTMPWWVPADLLATSPNGEHPMPTRAGVLSGSSSQQAPGISTQWSWTLTPRR